RAPATTCTRRFTLLFQCYRDHRALHSFPTRRSSDLDALVPGPVCVVEGAARAKARCVGDAHQFVIDVAAVQGQRPVGGVTAIERSEEHTSELQSRENLVCRLLLEKKKKSDRKYSST